MFFRAQFIRIFLIVCLFGSVSALAANPVLTYRGATLGDKPERVQMQMTSEFPHVNVIDPKSELDTYLFKAGDDEGMQGDSCAYAATSNRQKNCVSANFYFSRQQRLHNVYVTQSFMPAISLESLLGKLAKTYGNPRLTFRENIPASHPSNTAFVSPASELTSLVWGGNRTPTGSYCNSLYPGEAMERIGGRFVSASIHHQGNLVNGYSLRILDTASIKKTTAEMMEEIKRRAAARREKNDASVKF